MKTESVILPPGALVSRFGAVVVGVLIQVPFMLSVVEIVGATRDWYERAPSVRKRAAVLKPS